MVIEFSRKKLFIILSLLVVLIAVPLTLYLSQKPQEDRSHASAVNPDTTTVVTIDGHAITRGDLRQIAEEQVPAESVNSQALKDALTIAVERRILDIEAQNLGINADPNTVAGRVSAEDLSQNQAYYEVLKEQVTLADVHSVQATSIGFWSPTTTDSQSGVDSATLATQLTAGLGALSGIQTRMGKGDDLLTIASELTAQTPSLKPVLAVNGYILDTVDDSQKSLIANPKIIEFGDTSLDTSVRDGLFGMSVNDVKTFSNTETNKGGYVYKLIQKGNDSGANSYDEWLTTQEDALSIPKMSVALGTL